MHAAGAQSDLFRVQASGFTEFLKPAELGEVDEVLNLQALKEEL